MEKWCELSFPQNSSGFLYLVEDSNSHQNFSSTPLEAAKFKDKQEGLLRHWKVQSKMSYAVYVPTLDTLR